MLSELSIRDFAIITDLHILFGTGFNVLTGETGAGKSIILDALTLILGGRADTAFIRAGCEKASVEAVFALKPAVREAITPLLAAEEVELEGDGESLLVAREIRANGRNICRINGSPVKVSLLREVGELLVGIHGQGEHLALLNPKSHLPLLDAFAGVVEERKQLSAAVGQLRGLQKELSDLRQDERTRQQRLDMLRFQVQEIDAANLRVGEDEELRQERERLGNMAQLVQQTAVAISLLAGRPDEEIPSAADLLGQVEAAVAVLAKLDSTQQELLPRFQALFAEFNELASELRHYEDKLEHDPERLAFLEERLELMTRLRRKYGAEIGDILALRDKAYIELDNIEHSEERIEKLLKEIDKRLKQVGQAAVALSNKRQKAAKQLAKGIEKELGDLKMTAEFGVDFTRQPAQPPETGAYVGEERLAFDHSGIDVVEFLISTNPGEPLKPMAKVASGGETARLMLALKTVLAQADETPTLIFDEIDQGIGGRIGMVVGRKLWSLSSHAGHQVIVVTHLPQMAGFGDTHFHVSKRVADGRTTTQVLELDHPQRVDELGAMLGTKEDLGRVSAHSLLQEAQAVKNGQIAS